ncbi:LCP family protein, partial [Gordonia sp. CPCC 205515]|uniref:LCP family protein n=1 Tax=Gordonia sp. CPCC 205515 TaxID=3140791 RepID=UPI003AF386A9
DGAPRRRPPERGEPGARRRTPPPEKPREAQPQRRTSSGEIHTRRTDRAPDARRRRPSEDPRVRAAQPRNPRTGDGDGPPPRKPRPRPRPEQPVVEAPPTKNRISLGSTTARRGLGRGLVALLSAAVLLCTGYAWSSVNGLNSSITQLGGLGLGGGAADGATDILLVGMDSRTDAKGNPLSSQELQWLRAGDDVTTSTDTIILIRIPNDGSSATAISIPRDSYVDVPGIGMSKINAAYGATKEGTRRRDVEAGKPEADAEREGVQAGRKALIDSVANLTGVQVDHYAEVGLLGFALLTKAVGGVDVCLKDAVNEPFSGARFRAGRQTLNGPQALSFVRQRHGLPRGDLDRITRQQVFMASLTQKMLSANILADPGKLSDLENAVSRSVVIDDNWDVVKFAEQLRNLSGGRVKFATVPVVTDQGWSDDGQQSVVKVDPKQVQTFTDGLLNGKKNSGGIERSDYTVDVDNAGTIDGLASNVSNILTNKGFQTGKTSSNPADDLDSVIYARSADDAGAQQLAKDLGGIAVRADASLPDKRLRAVLTNTYEGPGSIVDTGAQADSTPQAEQVAGNRAPITAGTDGPTCVN